jgi:6-phosphogluconolactonase
MGDTTASAQVLVVVGGYADAAQPGIHVFQCDTATGSLVACATLDGIANPSFLVVHPNQRWLYAVSETSAHSDGTPGSVWALRYEPDPPILKPINHQPSGGDSPCHAQLDASGHWLLVSNYGTGTIAVLPILADGSLGEITDVVQHQGSSVHPQRQAGPHTHSSTVTPDNRFVIVADLGLDQLLVYAFDSSAGKLNAHARAETQPGAGPRHMVFHPGGQFMYVANELASSVSLYDYDATRGTLRQRQTIATLPAGPLENLPAHIAISPSGQRVYVSNRGHDSISVFDVEADGRLARATIASCGGTWPRHFALAPGDNFMLVANQRSDEVGVLRLSPGAEAIGTPVARVRVAQAACVQWYGGV